MLHVVIIMRVYCFRSNSRYGLFIMVVILSELTYFVSVNLSVLMALYFDTL